MKVQQEPAAPPGRFVHQALIYRSDDELLAVAVPFLREGALAGDPALVSVAARQRDALLGALADVTGITELDRTPYGDPLYALEANHRSLAALSRRGAQRIRIVGEVPHEPWRGWLRYEAALNDVFARLPVVAICPHDARTTPGDVLADVERTHPYLVQPDGRVVESERYREPTALIDERARQGADALEARAPDVVVTDPEPASAGDMVCALAEGTRLDADARDALRLAVGQVVANAIAHGEPPVLLRAWAEPDHVVAVATDAGTGPDNPYVGLLPLDLEADPQDANALYLVHQALSEVSMFRGPEGFTVRLVQRSRAGGVVAHAHQA